MNQPLGDPNMGAALYYSSPPEYAGLSFVGAIANSRPSDIFSHGLLSESFSEHSARDQAYSAAGDPS